MMQNIIPNIANIFLEDFNPIIPSIIPDICIGIAINGTAKNHSHTNPKRNDAEAFPFGPAEDIEIVGLKFFNISFASFSLSFKT